MATYLAASPFWKYQRKLTAMLEIGQQPKERPGSLGTVTQKEKGKKKLSLSSVKNQVLSLLCSPLLFRCNSDKLLSKFSLRKGAEESLPAGAPLITRSDTSQGRFKKVLKKV